MSDPHRILQISEPILRKSLKAPKKRSNFVTGPIGIGNEFPRTLALMNSCSLAAENLCQFIAPTDDEPKQSRCRKTALSCWNRRNASFHSALASTLTAHRAVGVRCEALERSSQALATPCVSASTSKPQRMGAPAAQCAPPIRFARVPLHCARAPLRGAHSKYKRTLV